MRVCKCCWECVRCRRAAAAPIADDRERLAVREHLVVDDGHADGDEDEDNVDSPSSDEDVLLSVRPATRSTTGGSIVSNRSINTL